MARHAPIDQPTKFLTAIRRGQITSGSQAAIKFGVSQTSVFNWLRKARAAGHKIITTHDRYGQDKWIIRKGKGK